jgi:eukaryotic translation initiation factor 2C
MLSAPINPQSGGVKGRAITVKTNIFPITALREAKCYQYDITMDPEVPAEISRRVFRQVEVILQGTHQDAWFVYDGLKNAFSMTSVGDSKFDIIVEKNPEEMQIPALKESSSRGGFGGGRGGRGGGGRGGGRGGYTRSAAPSLELKPCLVLDENSASGSFEKISVNIRQVSEVDLHNLILYAQGKRQEDESITHASTALSVALRHVPSMLYVPVGSNFFSPEGRSPISGGLEVWRGFHQSVRAMQAGHLGINIDVASTVFRKGGMTAIDYLIEVCDLRDVSGINNAPADVINRAIKGVNVVTTHRGDQKQRFRVSKLSRETAHSMKFEDKDKKTISVAEYFETEYQVKLRYPHLPLALKVSYS